MDRGQVRLDDVPDQHRPLSRKASLNAAAAGLDYAALTASELVINPVLVAGLGAYLYGAWRIMWKLTGYLWATSGRSAPALQSAISHHQHSAPDEEKRRAVGSAVAVWFAFCPILLGIGALGAWFAPSFLRTPPEHVNAVRLAATLLVVNTVALTLFTIPRAVLQGENLGYKRMGASAALIVAGGGLTVLAVKLGFGMAGIAASSIVVTVLTGWLFWRVTRRHVAWWGVARPDRAGLRWFFGLSGWFTAWKLINEAMIAGDVVVLGLLAPIELVTVYTLTRYVPDALSALLSNPLAGIAPGLGGLIGAGDHRRAVRARNDFMAVTWVAVVVAGTAIVLWNESFLTVWIGSRYYAGATATFLIVLMSAQFVLIRTDAYVIDLTLDLKKKVLLGLASTVLSVVAAVLLVSHFHLGIVGVVVGFMLGRAVLSIAYPILVGRAIGDPFLRQLRGATRTILVSAALFAVTAAMAGHLAVGSWVGLVVAAGVTALVTSALIVGLGLPGAQRRRLVRRARRIVARRTVAVGSA